MNNKVTVVADELGNVIGVSANNPEYGYVRVQQTINEISEGGWLRPSKRSALIKGKVEDLLNAGYKANQAIPGKIVVLESLEPFNPENPDQHLKIAGDTGVICCVDDEPIYRNTVYSPSASAEDVRLAHTNTEEIRAVQVSAKAMSQTLVNARPQEAAL